LGSEPQMGRGIFQFQNRNLNPREVWDLGYNPATDTSLLFWSTQSLLVHELYEALL